MSDLTARLEELEADRAAIREFNVAVRIARGVTPAALELLPEHLRAELPQDGRHGAFPSHVASAMGGQISRLRARLRRADGKVTR